jgi:glc operon protein GlcG
MTTPAADDTRLSRHQTEQLLAAGVAAANAHKVAVTLVVVDGGGHPLGLIRMDGVGSATAEVGLAKARSAAAFRRPIRLFAERLAKGEMGLLAVPGCVPLQGGLPVFDGARLIGAVAVSGASPEVDEVVAEAMLASLGAPAAG